MKQRHKENVKLAAHPTRENETQHRRSRLAKFCCRVLVDCFTSDIRIRKMGQSSPLDASRAGWGGQATNEGDSWHAAGTNQRSLGKCSGGGQHRCESVDVQGEGICGGHDNPHVNIDILKADLQTSAGVRSLAGTKLWSDEQSHNEIASE